MRIALVTDAWTPQVNGVVRTLTSVCGELRRRGHEIEVISPDLYRSLPCPTYPEIRLALAGSRSVGRRLERFDPAAIHLSTEGPLGWAARRWCLSHGRAFTTAYHTQFPDYLARRTGLSPSVFWPYIRRFHGAAAGVMVATETIRGQLRAQGLDRLRPWSRGVDLANFGPTVAPPDLFFTLARPIQLYVGRVAVEKNIEAFLRNAHPGSKVVVGDGPALAKLQARFPEVADRRFAFVHIDVDLHQPTKDSVDFFYPRLAAGGVLLCDDYGSTWCPGATRACDEFLADKPEKMIRLDAAGGFLIKGTSTGPPGITARDQMGAQLTG